MITGNNWQSSSTTGQAPAANAQSEAYQSAFALNDTQNHQAGAISAAPVQADAIIRWLAWVIDLLPAIILSLFAIIPLIGGLLSALLVTTYLLMRDYKGASLGKLLLGLKVVDRHGGPASQKALLLRNVTLALPQLLHIIPYLGIILTILVWAPVCFVESMCALIKGERVGDMLAGTMVVKK